MERRCTLCNTPGDMSQTRRFHISLPKKRGDYKDMVHSIDVHVPWPASLHASGYTVGGQDHITFLPMILQWRHRVSSTYPHPLCSSISQVKRDIHKKCRETKPTPGSTSKTISIASFQKGTIVFSPVRLKSSSMKSSVTSQKYSWPGSEQNQLIQVKVDVGVDDASIRMVDQ